MDLFAQENIMDHAQYPRNNGHLAAPSVTHEEHNPLCGDKVRFDLLLQDGLITDVRFSGRGCTISQAAASMLSEEVMGMQVADARGLTNERMLDLLGIPIGYARRKCALLGMVTLHRALEGQTSDPAAPQ